MNWTPFIPEEDESRISYTVSVTVAAVTKANDVERMPDVAPNETDNVEQSNSL